METAAIVTITRLATPYRSVSIAPRDETQRTSSLTGGIVIKAIKFVGVPVSDQQRALDFYTKTLGFRVITDQPFDDKQRWIELGIGRSSSGITLFTPEGQENRIGSFTGISFVADDVEATYDELAAKGVNFIQKPEKADWGTAAVFADPDGNQFVLGSA
jgi:catechol 2,3-dioxygenase-like lactoylglutathione lyase family enzyme